MNRKQFVQLASISAAIAATGGMAGCANRSLSNSTPPVTFTKKETGTGKAVYVPDGKNRFQEELMIWGIIPLQIKVSGKDTGGSHFVFEHDRMGKGGPPRHFHYEQDEWWYVVAGEFLIRIGDETFHARPGDSAFGPRGVPHTFAKIGEGEGKIILLFQPAGRFHFIESTTATRRSAGRGIPI